MKLETVAKVVLLAQLVITAPVTLVAAGVPAQIESNTASLTKEEFLGLARGLMSAKKAERQVAARTIEKRNNKTDESLVPALVDALFFTPRALRGDLNKVLQRLTGERHSGYYEWVEYVGSRQDLTSHPAYFDWKAGLLLNIDSEYRKIFYPGAPSRIRLEEIVSGGVKLAGIPAIDKPATLLAAKARYLRPGETVFGAVVGGEARAYPVRILSWHEMLNDEIGGVPVTLSFCTLCGSGILYRTRTDADSSYTFDTSGLLYRSNKLMVDRQTFSLWSNLTGEPVLGRLANSEFRLELLPSTLTTWAEWRERHPDTTVLDLKPIEREFGSSYGFDYRPGAADRARTGVRFPVWLKNDRLQRDAEVFAIRVNAAAKAYPLEVVLRKQIVNDELGGLALVLVADPKSGAVRAYRRGLETFQKSAVRNQLRGSSGGLWAVEEQGLVPIHPTDGALVYERLGGHIAFWFGWYAFYPQTEVY